MPLRRQSKTKYKDAIYQKDPVENKTYASAVLGKLRASLPEKPENSGEMGFMTQLVNSFINIDATEAFRIYEQLIPQMNELSDASAVLSPFQGNNNVRSGEFVISQGNGFGFYGADQSVVTSLAAKDPDHAARLTDMFSRREMRIAIKLQMAESLN